MPAPPSDVRIKLYSLFKQAEFGDAPSKQPSAFDVVARAKWDAWNGVRGMNRAEAESKYCALVDQLSGTSGEASPAAGASAPAASLKRARPGWFTALVRAACCLSREQDEERSLLPDEPPKEMVTPTAVAVADEERTANQMTHWLALPTELRRAIRCCLPGCQPEQARPNEFMVESKSGR